MGIILFLSYDNNFYIKAMDNRENHYPDDSWLHHLRWSLFDRVMYRMSQVYHQVVAISLILTKYFEDTLFFRSLSCLSLDQILETCSIAFMIFLATSHHPITIIAKLQFQVMCLSKYLFKGHKD